MNIERLNNLFNKIIEEAKIDYAFVNVDEIGECFTDVQGSIKMSLGAQSKGIFCRHWLKGMNKSCDYKELNEIYIAHDITEEQFNILLKICDENDYVVKNRNFDEKESIILRELNIAELIEKSGKCKSVVYNLAQKLNRLPTLKELSELKRGRPSKY